MIRGVVGRGLGGVMPVAPWHRRSCRGSTFLGIDVGGAEAETTRRRGGGRGHSSRRFMVSTLMVTAEVALRVGKLEVFQGDLPPRLVSSTRRLARKPLSVLASFEARPRRRCASRRTARGCATLTTPPLLLSLLCLLAKKSGKFSGWVFFLISSGSPHVRCTPMGRTCGGPDEIGLTPMGVKLNGPGRVPPTAPATRSQVKA